MLICAKLEYSMKINITLKLDSELLREARILAAEEGTLVSLTGGTAGRVSAEEERLRALKEACTSYFA